MFCFECNSIECNSTECIKKNKIVNKCLLSDDKFMPEMHLKQPGVTYSACGTFTETKKCLCRHKIQVLFTKMSLIKQAFNLIWLIVNQKLYQKELNHTKF